MHRSAEIALLAALGLVVLGYQLFFRTARRLAIPASF